MIFIKENWFKISILFFIIIFAITYLLVTYTSSKRKEDLANKLKCQQESQRILETDIGKVMIYDKYIFSESRFIPTLNTCLIRTTSSGESIDYTLTNNKYSIIDVYTHRVLAHYAISRGVTKSDIFSGDIGEFNNLLDKYFSDTD